jgi:hypothetical protein
MAGSKPGDARQNEAIAHAVVEQEWPSVSAIVGLHALGKLADMLPHAEFVEFVNQSVIAAHQMHAGQIPQQPQTEPQEQQQAMQPQNGNGEIQST